MKRAVNTACCLFLSMLLASGAMAFEATITASGVGFIAGGDVASARDQAIRDAQVRALETALGVEVDARAALHKSLLIDDTIVTRTKGVIRDYRVLDEGKEPLGLYRVTIAAQVDRVAMADELVRLAGEKRVLMVRGGSGPVAETGDKVLLKRLAEAFSSAGFKVAQTIVPEAGFLAMDAEKIRRLAVKTGNDLIVCLQLEASEPQCPTENFCACLVGGSARLYVGTTGILIASEDVKGVRGFGNTRDMAGSNALDEGAEALVNGLEEQIFLPPERNLKVVVRNIPDYDAYKSFKRTLATLRWVRTVEGDSVGYHPVTSVFLVRFVQDPDILAGMLGKLGGYRFEGRSGGVFRLESER